MSLIPMSRPNWRAALRDAHSRKDQVRLAAAERLAAASPAERGESLPALRHLADDRVGPIRAVAVQALGELRDTESFARIADRVSDLDYRVRQAALVALPAVGGDRALEIISAALRDSRPEMRFQAIGALAEVDASAASGAARELLADPDTEVRIRAAEVLGRVSDADAGDALASVLTDSHPAVGMTAALSLAHRGDGRGIDRLREGLLARDFALDAAEALGSLGATQAIPDLETLANRWTAPRLTRAAAAAALAELGDNSGVRLLESHLRGWRTSSRSYAVLRAGQLRLVALVPQLVRIARRPRGVDLAVLAEALRGLAASSRAAEQAFADLVEREPTLAGSGAVT